MTAQKLMRIVRAYAPTEVLARIDHIERLEMEARAKSQEAQCFWLDLEFSLSLKTAERNIPAPKGWERIEPVQVIVNGGDQ